MICLGWLQPHRQGRTRDDRREAAHRTRQALRQQAVRPRAHHPGRRGDLRRTRQEDLHIGGKPILEAGNETILGLGFGAIVALGVGMWVLRERRVSVPIHAGRGLLESMGWALLLPQLLAVLGAIFQAAGVGTQVGKITERILPDGQLFAAVALYCVGMFVFTVIMGNAFAAFPVMTAAIGWPVLVQHLHGNAAPVLAVGMLAGFCGTLCTPMAANFNLVPAALLELKDQYGPIKAQAPTAAVLLACNILVIYFFAF